MISIVFSLHNWLQATTVLYLLAKKIVWFLSSEKEKSYSAFPQTWIHFVWYLFTYADLVDSYMQAGTLSFAVLFINPADTRLTQYYQGLV
jgi:hypothetical protein